MSILILKNSIERLSSSLKNLEKENFEEKQAKNNLFDYKEKKLEYYLSSIESNLRIIRNTLPKINEYNTYDRNNERYILRSNDLLREIESLSKNKEYSKMRKSLQDLYDTLNLINEPKTNIFFKKPKNIPETIREEVVADINEIEKCFKFGCYRSATIICGRILETVLHRKYYELTNNDLLEKAPGIGLGKLVAKLTEVNIKFDPGLTQQIHLINQMRIFTVHKKKEIFNPSEAQTQAIILYTLDIIEKLFR